MCKCDPGALGPIVHTFADPDKATGTGTSCMSSWAVLDCGSLLMMLLGWTLFSLQQSRLIPDHLDLSNLQGIVMLRAHMCAAGRHRESSGNGYGFLCTAWTQLVCGPTAGAGFSHDSCPGDGCTAASPRPHHHHRS